jgi:hypothetical protein
MWCIAEERYPSALGTARRPTPTSKARAGRASDALSSGCCALGAVFMLNKVRVAETLSQTAHGVAWVIGARAFASAAGDALRKKVFVICFLTDLTYLANKVATVVS